MRDANLKRTTKETDISLQLTLDGTGKADIHTGVGFLDHMLTLFASHGRFDLTVTCRGDYEVDDHHSVEDIGIVLGEALKQALGDKAGICRYGSRILPMDEALILVSLDLSDRAYLGYDLTFSSEKIGTFDTELIQEFFLAFVRGSRTTLHLRQFAGSNSHHIAEAAFKAFARALREAVSMDERSNGEIPSTKGMLS